MNMKLQNQYIDIFPISAYRPDPNARVLNEANVSGMIKGLSDIHSFVASSSIDNAKPLEFYIQGYHCKITDIASLTDAFKDDIVIYAILIIEEGVASPIIHANPDTTQTNESEFEGLIFSNTPSITSDYIVHSLKILERPSKADTWNIPIESRRRFSINTLDMSNLIIDGGYEA